MQHTHTHTHFGSLGVSFRSSTLPRACSVLSHFWILECCFLFCFSTLNSSSVFSVYRFPLTCFSMCTSFTSLRQITQPAIRSGMEVEMCRPVEIFMCCIYCGRHTFAAISGREPFTLFTCNKESGCYEKLQRRT